MILTENSIFVTQIVVSIIFMNNLQVGLLKLSRYYGMQTIDKVKDTYVRLDFNTF